MFEYALTDRARVSSLLEMRRFQEDVLKPALAAIPGVAEVASVGGDLRQVRIDVKPRELRERGLAFTDVVAALRPVFRAASARRPDARRGARLDRGSRVAADAVPAAARAGAARSGCATWRSCARSRTCRPGSPTWRACARSAGSSSRKRDADIATLADAVKRAIAREARKLPHRAADPERLDSGVAADVHVSTAYDRSDLATRVRKTLLRALGEEVGVVVLVILLFLLHARSALVPLATLPVVLLLTFGGDVAARRAGDDHEPGRHRHRAGHGGRRRHRGAGGLRTGGSRRWRRARRPRTAAPSCWPRPQSFAPAILTSLVITALSFLPVFAFTRRDGPPAAPAGADQDAGRRCRPRW